MRRTKRWKSTKSVFPRILGFLCAEQNCGNLKNALSGFLGLLGAEQDVGNLEKWTFKNSGTPVRRTNRRKSKKMHVQEFWDSCAQNKTSEISKNALQKNTGIPARRTRSGKLQKCPFRNKRTPVRRTRRLK